MAQRAVVAMKPSYKNHEPYFRDIDQAYSQAESELERFVYLEAPFEMGLQEDEILLAIKPLYGIPESGLHWFVTFQGHHICLLYTSDAADD